MNPPLKPGTRFGKLVILEGGHRTHDGYRAYLCRCDCGGFVITRACALESKRTKSCGCLLKQRTGVTTHGMTNTSTYHIWSTMLQRCLNPNSPGYKYYGARGITVCTRWTTFTNFLEDMGERPEGLELDRIIATEGYYKENCRWVTHQKNMENMKNTNAKALFITLQDLTAEQFDALVASIGREEE